MSKLLRRTVFALRLAVLICWVPGLLIAGDQRLVLAHYMPWYATKAVSGQWGWHWTMNHFDPEQLDWEGRRKTASHDYPLIGLYDSSDDQALECQVLLMKVAGLDGVVIDWYGTSQINDNAVNHRNTQKLIPWLKKAGLRFAICYEDQALKSLDAASALKQATQDLQWAQQHWFSDAAYVRQEERPVLLVFGPQHLKREAWDALRAGLESKPMIFGLPHLVAEHRLDGGFIWPPVANGKALSAEQWRQELDHLYAREGRTIAGVFPGFKDIYQQAGVHPSYGSIGSDHGKTFAETLSIAMKSKAPLIQVATWNDYGEGTVIEPTRNHSYRYLEQLQQMRKAGSVADLRLPVMLYQLRKRGGDEVELSQAAQLLFDGKFIEAEAILAKASRSLGRGPATFCDTPELHDANYRLTTELLYREAKDASAEVHQRCRLDVYAPATKKGFPTVVWFHGGGLTAGERFVPLPLRNQGVGVVAVNYRLSPGVKSPVFIEDAAAAVAWTFKHIAEFGGDPKRIFISGHSAGAYLALMVGLDQRWLAPHGVKANDIAGLIPLSPQVITHFAIREERGMDEKQPVIDDLAPLFHVRKDAPPMLLVTGDREKELLGRYEENAYFWRMMKLTGHKDVSLHELDGFDHGKMPEPAFPLLLKFVEAHSAP